MTLLADPIPTLVTIPNVELLTVGEWDASTGPCSFTEADLRAAADALTDPAIKAPRLRIGHTPPEVTPEGSAGGFADQPAFGRFVNLRLDSTGTTLVADMAGVPAWLAEILPAAFPSRSIEGYHNVVTATGRKHDFVITSVALLGVSMPAIETLDDLRLAYGAEIPGGVEFVAGDRVTATRGEPMAARVSASVAYEDVRRSFYEDFATDESGRYWWWLQSFVVSPPLVVADDDEGGLWSVPYTIKGDAVTWGDPTEVKVQYVEVGTGKVAASRSTGDAERVLASAEESRPDGRVRANTTGGAEMSVIEKIREKLGVGETATDDEVLAKLDEIKAETPPDDEKPDDEPQGEPEKEKPEAVAASEEAKVRLLEHANAQLAKRVEDLETKLDKRENDDTKTRRDSLVAAALREGQIRPDEHDLYRANLDINEDATAKVLAALPKGRVPVAERGSAPPATTAATDLGWFPQFPIQTAKEAVNHG